MNRMFMLAGLLALAPLTGARAGQTDGKALVGHSALAREVTKSASDGLLDAARTRAFLRAILLDNTSDPQELDLVAELMRPGTKPVTVELPSGQFAQLPAPDEGGRALLELFTQPVDVNELWLNPAGEIVRKGGQ